MAAQFVKGWYAINKYRFKQTARRIKKMYVTDITIEAATDGKTGTTTYAYSNFITGKLLAFTYIPTTGSHYSTGNSVGDYELVLTRRSTGATQDDVKIKQFKVYPARRHYTVSSPMRGSTGKPITTTGYAPFLPLADEQLRVIIQPATSPNSKNATIRLLVDGSPNLERRAT